MVYVDVELINSMAKLLGSLVALGGALIALYKFYEQTLICYGVLACLKGLKEQGCNGPVTAALEKMEKHLNQAAHQEGEE